MKIKANKLNMQILFFILALLLFYFLLKPLLNIFLASIILTYVFYPLFKWVRERLKYESISILATLAIIIILFLMPFAFVASQVPKQVSNIYNYAKENIIGKGIISFDCEENKATRCKIINFVTGSGLFNFDEITNSLFKKISQIATYIVVRVPNTIAAVVISFFISFFLFKDGKNLLRNVVDVLPMSKKKSNNLIERFGKVTYSVVYAHIIVAIMQGVLGAIGFYIFGIPSAIFWGVIMSIFALIPMVGPALIWLPTSLFLILNGIITNSYWGIGMGIGLMLYGVLIISIADNIIRIKIIGSSHEVHPLTVLIGIIGGINLFGLTGIFIGPIILSLLLTFFKDYSGKFD